MHRAAAQDVVTDAIINMVVYGDTDCVSQFEENPTLEFSENDHGQLQARLQGYDFAIIVQPITTASTGH